MMIGRALLNLLTSLIALAASLWLLAAVIATTAIGADGLRAAMGLEGVSLTQIIMPALAGAGLLGAFVIREARQ